jgi:hypothetical protein
MTQEIQPWRTSPFLVGHTYRVRRDFNSLRDTFTAGEMLIYEGDVYSHYHEYTGYIFSQPGIEQKRIWDIHDDDEESWQNLFEEIG